VIGAPLSLAGAVHVIVILCDAKDEPKLVGASGAADDDAISRTFDVLLGLPKSKQKRKQIKKAINKKYHLLFSCEHL
jgi:ABC-type cobalamin transport system permease subunit